MTIAIINICAGIFNLGIVIYHVIKRKDFPTWNFIATVVSLLIGILLLCLNW